MIIVSGPPRSGTSLTMDIMRDGVGEDNIIGFKFQREEINQREFETDEEFEIRKYLIEKRKAKRDAGDYKDMNPNGFWECAFTVPGVGGKYSSRDFSYNHSRFLQHVYEERKDHVCKIVSQGIFRSDPKFIDKVVYLIRHPRNVAKSQERIVRGFDVEYEGEVKNIFNGQQVHSPKDYIDVTTKVCRWIIDNPEIPFLFIKYDDLHDKTEETIKKIADFVGYGDFSNAHKLIDPNLNRSKPEDVKSDLWEEAEFVYEKFIAKEYEEILKYFEDPKTKFNKATRTWFCTRINRRVNNTMCHKCLSKPVFRENYKSSALKQGIDYLEEPCMFECGMNVDREEHLTIEESINNNSWEQDDHEAQYFIKQHEECHDCEEKRQKLRSRNANRIQ